MANCWQLAKLGKGGVCVHRTSLASSVSLKFFTIKSWGAEGLALETHPRDPFGQETPLLECLLSRVIIIEPTS